MKDEYFKKYFLETKFEITSKKKKTLGPVITIARDFGCYSSNIANLLVERINKELGVENKWRWLSNEILTEAAQSLKVEPSKISHIFGAEERPFLQEIIESLTTKKYVCDENIKRTIVRIVKKYAEVGNVVIVGRGGCAVTRHIENSLHIKFIAPLEWRIQKVQERFELTPAAARKKVQEVEERRKVFMKFYDGDKPDSDLYDAIFNRSILTEEQIVDGIVCLAKSKKLI